MKSSTLHLVHDGGEIVVESMLNLFRRRLLGTLLGAMFGQVLTGSVKSWWVYCGSRGNANFIILPSFEIAQQSSRSPSKD